MINLLKFSQLFESVEYSYTIDDVKALPTYKILETLGFVDSTTNAIWGHGNMRLYNEELNMNDASEAITIYQNGPIRKTVAGYGGVGRPHILKTFESSIQNIGDWNSRFLYIISWAKKRFKRYKSIDLGHFDRVPEDKLGEYLVAAYRSDIDNFIKMYALLSDTQVSIFLDELGLSASEFANIIDRYNSMKNRLSVI
jgi:hypothetical protein